jgi:hypothetical protein
MGILGLLLLGFGIVYLMSRGNTGMGCCGGSHESHESKSSKNIFSENSRINLDKDIIDLGEDQYTVLSEKYLDNKK